MGLRYVTLVVKGLKEYLLLFLSKYTVEDMKHVVAFVHTYIRCLPIPSGDLEAADQNLDEIRRIYGDDVCDVSASAYANVTGFVCEIFLKIAVQYCHANMECDVVNACLTAEFYDGSLTCQLPTCLSEVAQNDVEFSLEYKVVQEYYYLKKRELMRYFLHF